MDDKNQLSALTTTIVAAFVAHNTVAASELPKLIAETHAALLRTIEGAPPPVVVDAKSPITIKKSIHNDYLICFEDGEKFKSLKRHLRSHYGMSPEQYRAKWKLPADYPMVAPGYAKTRSTLAKTMGLGRKTGPKN